MKINGRKLIGPNIEYAVIPRPEGNIVFKATAIMDWTDFNTIVPEPKPGIKVLPGGAKVPNFEDTVYLTQVKEYNEKKFAYRFIFSLRETEGLEWETVKFSDPDTWKNYEKELKESGFSEEEVAYIEMTVINANGLNQKKLDDMRKDFLAGLQAVIATQ